MIVAIPMRNRHELTAAVVEQLVPEGPELLLIFDNGSDDPEARAWLDGLDDEHGPDGVVVVRRPDAGIHEMWNAAIDLAKGRPLCLLNNDVRLGPNFLAGMQAALDYDPRLLAVSANYDGRLIRQPVAPARHICAGRYDGTGGFAGFAFAMRTDTGYRFPEELKWWGGDNHLVAWAWSTQRWVGIARDVTVEHLDGGSQTIGQPDELWARTPMGRQCLADVELLPTLLEKL